MRREEERCEEVGRKMFRNSFTQKMAVAKRRKEGKEDVRREEEKCEEGG